MPQLLEPQHRGVRPGPILLLAVLTGGVALGALPEAADDGYAAAPEDGGLEGGTQQGEQILTASGTEHAVEPGGEEPLVAGLATTPPTGKAAKRDKPNKGHKDKKDKGHSEKAKASTSQMAETPASSTGKKRKELSPAKTKASKKARSDSGSSSTATKARKKAYRKKLKKQKRSTSSSGSGKTEKTARSRKRGPTGPPLQMSSTAFGSAWNLPPLQGGLPAMSSQPTLPFTMNPYGWMPTAAGPLIQQQPQPIPVVQHLQQAQDPQQEALKTKLTTTQTQLEQLKIEKAKVEVKSRNEQGLNLHYQRLHIKVLEQIIGAEKTKLVTDEGRSEEVLQEEINKLLKDQRRLKDTDVVMAQLQAKLCSMTELVQTVAVIPQRKMPQQAAQAAAQAATKSGPPPKAEPAAAAPTAVLKKAAEVKQTNPKAKPKSGETGTTAEEPSIDKWLSKLCTEAQQTRADEETIHFVQHAAARYDIISETPEELGAKLLEWDETTPFSDPDMGTKLRGKMHSLLVYGVPHSLGPMKDHFVTAGRLATTVSQYADLTEVGILDILGLAYWTPEITVKAHMAIQVFPEEFRGLTQPTPTSHHYIFLIRYNGKHAMAPDGGKISNSKGEGKGSSKWKKPWQQEEEWNKWPKKDKNKDKESA